MLEALYDKTFLPKCVGNSLEMHFEFLTCFCSSKTDNSYKLWAVIIGKLIFWNMIFLTDFLPTHLFGQLILDNSLFCKTNFFDPTEFLTTDILSTDFFDN